MNGHTVKLDDPEHEAAQALLPWYAADRLDAADSAAVRRHLADCAACRAELDFERRVQAAAALPGGRVGVDQRGAAGPATATGPNFAGGLAAAGPTIVADPTTSAGLSAAAGPIAAAAELNVERALAALLPRLDTPAPVPKPAPTLAPAPTSAPTSAPARSWWRRVAANDASWLRWALAAQFIVIAGLALLLARPVTDDGAYHVLGAGAASGNLVVMFKPETAERDLRRILQANGAHVVDGPTVTDAYLLSVPDPRTARARLRAEPAVVLAETLDGGALP